MIYFFPDKLKMEDSPSLAETVKVKCRICKKELLRKNYKMHLKTAHPNSNSNDMSPFGQLKLSDIFTKAKERNKQTSDNITDLDIDEAEMPPEPENIEERKRMHESRESTDSGLGEASTPKKTRMEDVFDKDEVQVTAEMINEKLDKVLKVVEELRDEKVFVKPVTKHDAPVEMPNWIKHSRSMIFV